jgi:hypothetical protein
MKNRQTRLFVFIGAALLVAAAILFVIALNENFGGLRVALNCMLQFECRGYLGVEAAPQLLPFAFYGALVFFAVALFRIFVGPSDKKDDPPS